MSSTSIAWLLMKRKFLHQFREHLFATKVAARDQIGPSPNTGHTSSIDVEAMIGGINLQRVMGERERVRFSVKNKVATNYRVNRSKIAKKG